MRQLLQNETENSYQKFVTKCDRGLLQSASGITKCDRLLLQSASGITKCDRLLLQSASGITKCDSYYKVRRSKYLQNQLKLLTESNKGRYYLRISKKLIDPMTSAKTSWFNIEIVVKRQKRSLYTSPLSLE